MYVQYGKTGDGFGAVFRHPDNTVNVRYSVQHVNGQYGYREAVRDVMELRGKLKAADQYEMTTKIQQLVNAYSVNGRHLALYHDNDDETPHGIKGVGADVLIPTVVSARVYPRGDREQYVCVRDYVITAFGLRAANENPVVYYDEWIEYTGFTGAMTTLKPTQAGVFAVQLAPAWPQRIVQRGRSRGITGYKLPVGPLYPNSTVWPLCKETPRDPINYRGPSDGIGAVGWYYDYEWVYVMDNATPVNP